MSHCIRDALRQAVFLGEGMACESLLRVLLDQVLQEWDRLTLLSSILQVLQQSIHFRLGLGQLVQTDVQVDQAFSNRDIFGFEGA